MIDLATWALSDVNACCAELRRCTAGAVSAEDAAQRLVQFLRDSFSDPADGRPAFALARLFVTESWNGLPPDVQRFAERRAAPGTALDGVRCLALLATRGDGEGWNYRQSSRTHQALPLASAAAITDAPMIAALVAELGLGVESLLAQVQGDLVERNDFGVFHVECAQGSRRVTAQDFVAEHGIESVIGFGGVLPPGDVFAVVLFSRVPISERTAQLFRMLAVSAKLAMLPFADAPLFTGGPTRIRDQAMDVAQARAVALEQMLRVQDSTVANQARSLEQSLEALRGRDVQLRREAEIVETLHVIGEHLNADLDLDRVIQHATQAARQVTNGQLAAFLSDSLADVSPVVVSARNAPHDAASLFDQPQLHARLASTLAGMRVVRSGDIYSDGRCDALLSQGLIPSKRSEAGPDSESRVRSYLLVPVVSARGVVHGALVITSDQPDLFDERAESIVVGLAGQTAVALDNARLYRDQRKTALELQRHLLPPHPVVDGLDIAARYAPSTAGLDVGGDWYDVIPLASGRIALAVGDVMGHGVRAAATMGQLRTAIRAYARLDLPPGEVIGLLNQLVSELPGEQIATCIYAVYDPGDGTMVVSNAGHVPALLSRPKEIAVRVATSVGPPLGVENYDFGELEVSFPVGATLLLYTDGLVESRSRPVDVGIDELQSLFSGDGDLDELCDKLVTALAAPGTRDDDIALLCVRNSATDARPAAVMDLEADATTAARARAFIADVLAGWGVGSRTTESVLAVAHELVANSLVHTNSAGDLRLRVAEGGAILVEVTDSDPRLPRLTRAALLDEAYRGLLIVARLTQRWGARPTPEGKVVWALVAPRESDSRSRGARG